MAAATATAAMATAAWSSLSAASSASSSLSSSLSSSGNQTASLRAYMGALGEAQRDALRGIVKGAIKRMGEERQMSATLPMFEILGYTEVTATRTSTASTGSPTSPRTHTPTAVSSLVDKLMEQLATRGAGCSRVCVVRGRRGRGLVVERTRGRKTRTGVVDDACSPQSYVRGINQYDIPSK